MKLLNKKSRCHGIGFVICCPCFEKWYHFKSGLCFDEEIVASFNIFICKTLSVSFISNVACEVDKYNFHDV